jgi:hypothetical protein
MIWKLFAVLVAMSDTGSIAMTQVATDFVSQQACELAAHQLFPAGFERDLAGHRFTLRASAECRPDGIVLPPEQYLDQRYLGRSPSANYRRYQ